MAEEIPESLPVSVATTNETDVDGATQLGESETLGEDTQPTKRRKKLRKRPRVAPTVAEDENAAEQGDIVATQVASVGSERSGERSAAVPSPEAAGPPAAVGSSPGAASPGAGSSSAPELGAASPSSGLSAAPQEERQEPLASQATVSDSIAALPSRMERLNAQMAQNLAPVVAGPGGTALKEGEDWWDLELDESREYKRLE